MARAFTQREKNIFYLTIAVVVFAVLFNLAVAPVLDKSDRINRQIRLGRLRLVKYAALIAQKDYLQDRYAKFFSGSQLPGRVDQVPAGGLAELEDLAGSSGIKILDLRPGPAITAATGYKEVPIDLRTEGEIGGYFKFIYHLQNSPSLLRIKNFQLNARSGSSILEGSFSIYQISPSNS